MVLHVMAPAPLMLRLLGLGLWEWYAGEPMAPSVTSGLRDQLVALAPPELAEVAREFLARGAAHAWTVDDLARFWWAFSLPHTHAMPAPREVAAQDGH